MIIRMRLRLPEPSLSRSFSSESMLRHGRFASGEFHYDLSPERALSRDRGFDVSAASTVPPALAAASEFPDWEGAVRAAICLGGDADTLACTTGAAEALHGLPNYVAEQAPAHLTDGLRRVVARFEQSVAQLRYAERHRRGSPKDV